MCFILNRFNHFLPNLLISRSGWKTLSIVNQNDRKQYFISFSKTIWTQPVWPDGRFFKFWVTSFVAKVAQMYVTF